MRAHSLHRPSEDLSPDVATDADQVVHRRAVIAPLHRLLDNRPLVETASHEISDGADQLHAAIMRPVIRLRAPKAPQGALMDVNVPIGEATIDDRYPG
jgi:hypothetical protein